MEPIDVYKYYVERTVKDLKLKEMEEQVRDLKKMEATLAIIDFCGKIPLVHRLFGKVKAEVFVVYDHVQDEELASITSSCDIVYVLEDIECIEKNVFYSRNMGNAIFLLFDRFRFVKCM